MVARFVKVFLILSGLMALTDCVPSIKGLESKTARPWKRTYFYAHALSAIPVFNHDVETFTSYWSTRFGVPKKSYLFGENSPRLTRPTAANTSGAIADLAKRARRGEDMVVVMMSTEGGPDTLMIQPAGSQPYAYPAELLRTFLEPLTNDLQLIVIQACHSGTIIDDLAHPNRIIIASDAVDSTPQACVPSGTLTPFTTSFVDSMQAGGSLQEIFERAQVNLQRHTASLPYPRRTNAPAQVYIGENMTRYWIEQTFWGEQSVRTP